MERETSSPVPGQVIQVAPGIRVGTYVEEEALILRFEALGGEVQTYQAPCSGELTFVVAVGTEFELEGGSLFTIDPDAQRPASQMADPFDEEAEQAFFSGPDGGEDALPWGPPNGGAPMPPPAVPGGEVPLREEPEAEQSWWQRAWWLFMGHEVTLQPVLLVLLAIFFMIAGVIINKMMALEAELKPGPAAVTLTDDARQQLVDDFRGETANMESAARQFERQYQVIFRAAAQVREGVSMGTYLAENGALVFAIDWLDRALSSDQMADDKRRQIAMDAVERWSSEHLPTEVEEHAPEPLDFEELAGQLVVQIQAVRGDEAQPLEGEERDALNRLAAAAGLKLVEQQNEGTASAQLAEAEKVVESALRDEATKAEANQALERLVTLAQRQLIPEGAADRLLVGIEMVQAGHADLGDDEVIPKAFLDGFQQVMKALNLPTEGQARVAVAASLEAQRTREEGPLSREEALQNLESILALAGYERPVYQDLDILDDFGFAPGHEGGSEQPVFTFEVKRCLQPGERVELWYRGAEDDAAPRRLSALELLGHQTLGASCGISARVLDQPFWASIPDGKANGDWPVEGTYILRVSPPEASADGKPE